MNVYGVMARINKLPALARYRQFAHIVAYPVVPHIDRKSMLPCTILFLPEASFPV